MRESIQLRRVSQRILLLRGHRVLLSSEPAELYEVEHRALIQAVKRNLKRFPEDFMFQLSEKEWGTLRSQIVILETGRGRHTKYLPYAFTEHGVAMLSSVLSSHRAIEVSIEVRRLRGHPRADGGAGSSEAQADRLCERVIASALDFGQQAYARAFRNGIVKRRLRPAVSILANADG
jgi:hypothetical protein